MNTRARVVVGVVLAALLMIGAALVLSWVARGDAFFWLWIAVGFGLVAEVVILARRSEGREWLRRRWWLVAMQTAGVVIGVTVQVVR